MKKLIGILSLITIFAACKKDTPNTGLGTGCAASVTENFTLNVKYVKDCSFRGVAEGTSILWQNSGKDITIKTIDALGNSSQNYQKTGSPCSISDFLTGTLFPEGMSRSFGIQRIKKNESLLIIQNDSMTVKVQFVYNANTSALLKDSLALGYDFLYTKLPVLTKDSAFTMRLVARNRVYWLDNSGNYSPLTKLNLKLKNSNMDATLLKPAASYCGIDSIIIQ
jgi:hypothetical protein